MGLSRSYDTGQLKRKLVPAIGELEQHGFIGSLPLERRFTRITKGVWQVVFSNGKRREVSSTNKPSPALESLLRHGVHRGTAERLVVDYPSKTIGHYVAVLEWILKRRDIQKPRSVAGYLVQSIREGYETPMGFHSPARRCRPKRQVSETTASSSELRRQRRVAEYLERLPDAQRGRLEEDAMKSASEPMMEAYRRAQRQGQPLLISLYRRLILEEYVVRVLPE